jgi:2-oxoglutarate ferredoxin oxidoreductase subunit beta
MPDTLLNRSRPPVFCPGCAHERVVHALDQALTGMGLAGQDVAIVSDIGCSGLFDTFFNTHAFHGLHGRALTYATGLKLARPDLTVIVTMGDGGLGIGGAHVLSACRRNLDLTLLVLNNFNYGMTGGQCSATTPPEARVGSGFLNRLEKPLDIGQVAGTAGAAWVERVSTYTKDLAARIQAAIAFEGFALLDIWGVCPGRYTKANKLTPQSIDAQLAEQPSLEHFKAQNTRPEYGRAYRAEAAKLQAPAPPAAIAAGHAAPGKGRREVVLLGSAGQRILTAGEILCLAGAAAGLYASQKNDYPITVMRGHSVSEIILSETPIGFTGIEAPAVVLALAAEGVARRKAMFAQLAADTLVIKARDVDLPAGAYRVAEIDFGAHKVKSADRAVAALAWLAVRETVLNRGMLDEALNLRFAGGLREALAAQVAAVAAWAGRG